MVFSVLKALYDASEFVFHYFGKLVIAVLWYYSCRVFMQLNEQKSI